MTELKPIKYRAIALLVGTKSITDIAELLEVSRTSLYRWLEEPDFQAELQRTQNSLMDTSMSLLAGQARLAAEVIIEIMTDPTISPAIRLNAARIALLDTMNLRSKHGVEKRLLDIEKALKEQL